LFPRIYNGTKKKLRVKRKTFDENGKIKREDKDLEINVKPGMKPGSKFKFKGVGDEIDGTKQDLHFIIEEVSNVLSFSQYTHKLIFGHRNHTSALFVKGIISSPQLLYRSRTLSSAGHEQLKRLTGRG